MLFGFIQHIWRRLAEASLRGKLYPLGEIFIYDLMNVQCIHNSLPMVIRIN